MQKENLESSKREVNHHIQGSSVRSLADFSSETLIPPEDIGSINSKC